MSTVCLIGAGSMVFTRRLVSDLLQQPATRDLSIHLVDIHADRLATSHRLVGKMMAEAGSQGRVQSFLDRRAGLSNVDYVINTIEVGGMDAWKLDFEIPERYGIHQTVGDTLGIGGIFRALRTIPPILDIIHDVEDVAPNAIVLNYTNPMSMVVMAVAPHTDLPFIGLCHGIPHTFVQLASYLEKSVQDITWKVAGINHMAWILTMKEGNKDLYPELFVRSKDPAVRKQDPVRFEILNRFGYFVTESSAHNAEYTAFFLPHREEWDRLQIVAQQ